MKDSEVRKEKSHFVCIHRDCIRQAWINRL
jgi:hypothetical protein